VNIQVGKKALITTDCWFIAPNGKQYRSVFGTVKAVQSSEETLGVRTNARSTNWYVEIGCMTLAGCQIHYAIRADACNFEQVEDYSTGSDGIRVFTKPSSIFDADAVYGTH
jgi:hypothetical protein